jgi:hypothetical protein
MGLIFVEVVEALGRTAVIALGSCAAEKSSDKRWVRLR